MFGLSDAIAERLAAQRETEEVAATDDMQTLIVVRGIEVMEYTKALGYKYKMGPKLIGDAGAVESGRENGKHAPINMAVNGKGAAKQLS